jgi:poly(beta-D-mannuronate) lyase
MRRQEMSLHYQNFAIMPLVMIAELAQRQGVDAYDMVSNGHRLRDAVDFLLDALDDPSLVRHYEPLPQRPIDPSDFAWMAYWQRRFPDPRIPRLMPAELFNRRLGGGVTALLETTPLQKTNLEPQR